MTLALVAAGCGGGDEEPSGAQGTGDTPQLQDLITPGTLTAGTELPAPPFWIGDDYDFSQVTITLERDRVVDFTEPYFDANQGVLARTGTKVAGLDDAKQLQWGAQLNTTGALFISDKIQPAKEARIFDRTVDAFAALNAARSTPSCSTPRSCSARSRRSRSRTPRWSAS